MLMGQLAAVFPGVDISAGPADPAGYDLVINGTSLGMHAGDALPVDPDRLSLGTLVAEVVMQPDVTPLLAAAGRRAPSGFTRVST